MTLLDAYESFLRNVDKFQVSAITIPDFLHCFHLARMQYVDERLDHMEQVGAIDDDLTGFYIEKEYAVPSDRRLKKPADYHRTALMQCYFSIPDTCADTSIQETGMVAVRRLTADKEGFIMQNPYYKPSRERWYYKQSGGVCILYGDSAVSITKLVWTYFPELPLYTVQDMASQVVLPFSFSQMAKICTKAATLFLEIKESARVRSQPAVQNGNAA